MKGKLIKKKDKWYVIRIEEGDWETYYPLHSNDADLMVFKGQLPNNQHIMNGKEVEFEIVKEYIDNYTNQVQKYAKIINQVPDIDFQTKPGFVERRMALGKLNNDKLWDEIYSEYSNEQYPPFGGPFTDALSFIDWLKQNYISPERIK